MKIKELHLKDCFTPDDELCGQEIETFIKEAQCLSESLKVYVDHCFKYDAEGAGDLNHKVFSALIVLFISIDFIRFDDSNIDHDEDSYCYNFHIKGYLDMTLQATTCDIYHAEVDFSIYDCNSTLLYELSSAASNAESLRIFHLSDLDGCDHYTSLDKLIIDSKYKPSKNDKINQKWRLYFNNLTSLTLTSSHVGMLSISHCLSLLNLV